MLFKIQRHRRGLKACPACPRHPRALDDGPASQWRPSFERVGGSEDHTGARRRRRSWPARCRPGHGFESFSCPQRLVHRFQHGASCVERCRPGTRHKDRLAARHSWASELRRHLRRWADMSTQGVLVKWLGMACAPFSLHCV